MVPLTIKQSTSPFDYDRLLNNPNLELWVVRVPDTVRPAVCSTPACTSVLSSKLTSALPLAFPDRPTAQDAPPVHADGLVRVDVDRRTNDDGLAVDKDDRLHAQDVREGRVRRGDGKLAASAAVKGKGRIHARSVRLPPAMDRSRLLSRRPATPAHPETDISAPAYPICLTAPRPITNHLVLAPTPLVQPTASAPSTRYVPPVKPPRVQPADKLKFRNTPFGFNKVTGDVEDLTKLAEEDEAVAVEKTKKRKAAAVAEDGSAPAEGEKKKKKSKKDKAA